MSTTVPAFLAVLAPFAGLVVVAGACEVVGSIGGVDDLAVGGSDSATSTGGMEKLPDGPQRPRDTDDDLATSSAGAGMPSDTSNSSDGADTPTKLDLGRGNDTDTDTDTDTVGTFGAACCSASTEPGCAEDSALEACVCGFDAYCCDTAWDDTCVGIATWGECGGGCSDPEIPPTDCCLASELAGCIDAQVSACVCEHDPYCCDVAWDDVCVGDVALHDCGLCP